ncbi:MAG: MarR family winged helix-turn-helix transcriptional regulator [Marmoricola sp.]
MTSDKPWLSDEQQNVWRSWVALTAQLPAYLHRELQADAGLSLPDFDVLVQLTDAFENRVRVLDLARELAWERSRVSHHVSRMEVRGLVRREECPDDGRGAFVVLTDQGRAAIERAAPNHVRAVRGVVFDGLDEAETAALGQALEVMLSALERTREESSPAARTSGGVRRG